MRTTDRARLNQILSFGCGGLFCLLLDSFVHDGSVEANPAVFAGIALLIVAGLLLADLTINE